MNNDRLKELQRQWAEDKKEEDEQIKLNPLSQYSTTQLKRELRKRVFDIDYKDIVKKA